MTHTFKLTAKGALVPTNSRLQDAEDIARSITAALAQGDMTSTRWALVEGYARQLRQLARSQVYVAREANRVARAAKKAQGAR